MKLEHRWLNVFIRDLLLTIVMTVVNFYNGFESWWAGCITGMLIVLISWHFCEYMNHRRLEKWRLTEKP